jgi:DNA-binding SARP family transcriptional activator/Tfp pilus assembly protein PilF
VALSFSALGRLEVRDEQDPVLIAGENPQAVLGLLLVAAGRPVQVEVLQADLWEPDAVPRQPRQGVHQAIKSLRKALGDADKTVIVSAHSSYRLVVARAAVDLYRFRDLLAQARAELDLHRRVDLARQALTLWRGEPFEGLSAPGLAPESSRLGEMHLQMLDALFDAQLALGRHREVLPDIWWWSTQQPDREGFCRQLMLAQYRSGEPTKASDVYQQFREHLEESLGAQPSPGLRDLHRRISRQDPGLQLGVPQAATARPVPSLHPLPAVTTNFVGRLTEQDVLNDWHHRRQQASPGPLICAIAGPGGVGKTTLALRWARQHEDLFPDGTLFADLRGFDQHDQPAAPGAVLHQFLEGLGVAPDHIPQSTDARADLFRSLVKDKQLLVVLDNAADARQVMTLLPGGARCCVLVTSRNQVASALSGLGVVHLPLKPLPEDESRELLRNAIGPRADKEPAAVDRVLAVCGGLPLAICVVSGIAQVQSSASLEDIAKELEGHHLTTLDSAGTDPGFSAAMACSWEALDERSRQLAGLLALVPGPDLSHAAAAAVLDIPPGEVAATLRVLEYASLLEKEHGRYFMLSLVREYLAWRGSDTLPAERVTTAHHDLAHFYLHTADTADRLLHPQRPRITLTRPTALTTARFEDRKAAMAWFDTEHRNLLDMQQLSATHGWHDMTWQLAWAMHTFHHRRGHIEEHLSSLSTGQQATSHLADPSQQALAYLLLAGPCARSGQPDRAHQHLASALTLAKRHRDTFLQARVHQFAAWVLGEQEAFREASEAANQALRWYRHLQDDAGTAQVLNACGWFATHNQDFSLALTYCTEALELARRTGDRDTEAAVVDSLGYLGMATGEVHQAVIHYEHAVDMLSELGNNHAEASTRQRLGECYVHLGRTALAIDAWACAIQLLEDQHRHHDAERLQDRLNDLLRPGEKQSPQLE